MRRAILLLTMIMAALLFGPGAKPAQTQTPSPSQATYYEVQDLGKIGDIETSPSGINDRGAVVGRSVVTLGEDEDHRAFLKETGQPMKDLGTLGGNYNSAHGVNDSGAVVGSSQNSDGNQRAFLYENGQMKDLGTLGGPHSFAFGINTSGQVVGSSRTSTGSSLRAFLYENGQMKDLGTLGRDYSLAYGINDSGAVVGRSLSSSGYRAFLKEAGQPMKELGTLGGNYGFARDINNSGAVVGFEENSNSNNRAFLYENGQMKDLGTLGGKYAHAESINDPGVVVGASQNSDGNQRAFLYENGQMKDLNTLIPADSGWTLLSAAAINNDGQIAATGRKANEQRYFALLITPDTTAPILTLPQEETVEATGLNGATVTFQASATDVNPVNPPVNCSKNSGDTFPLGTTKVTCEATDAAGNKATGSFNVTVKDTTAPAISGVPEDIATEASGSSSAQVSYASPTATDSVDGNVSVQCSPASGATFPIGDTTVSCEATDAAGNKATGSFNVTVQTPTPPRVTSVVPVKNDTSAAPAKDVVAFFSEPMREGSINAKTFKLFKVGNKSAVEATVTYSAATMQATLDPSANLQRGAEYKAVVNTGAEDMVGNSLDQNPSKEGNQKQVWRFTVRN